MHITVSFKDHSSFCTCMLLIKETKKKSWMTERKQGNHHKQTAGQWEGDLNVNRAVRNCCVQQRVICHCLCSTLNMATPRRLLQVNVTMSMNKGYIFPQNQLKCWNCFGYIIWNSAPPGVQITDRCCCSLWDVFVLGPANPGHFKVPYQHWTRCKSVSAVQDRKQTFLTEAV